MLSIIKTNILDFAQSKLIKLIIKPIKLITEMENYYGYGYDQDARLQAQQRNIETQQQYNNRRDSFYAVSTSSRGEHYRSSSAVKQQQLPNYGTSTSIRDYQQPYQPVVHSDIARTNDPQTTSVNSRVNPQVNQVNPQQSSSSSAHNTDFIIGYSAPETKKPTRQTIVLCNHRGETAEFAELPGKDSVWRPFFSLPKHILDQQK